MDVVYPTIVACGNALGRGQDRESLTQFIVTLAQTIGPEATMKHVDSAEYIKRLAAAAGIDVLNLIKSEEQLQKEMQQQQQMMQQQEMTKQMGQLASAPIMDPSKNPAMLEEPEGAEEQPPIEE